MDFISGFVETVALLNEFVLKVVCHRQTSLFQAWSNWIREDFTSRPCQWLRPEFVPPAPFWFWFSQHLSMLIFVKHGCLIFVVRDTLLSPSKPFWILLVIFFHRSFFWTFPFSWGGALSSCYGQEIHCCFFWMAVLGMRLSYFSFLVCGSCFSSSAG